jgi:DNA-binding Lrp family transcriptional regulator
MRAIDRIDAEILGALQNNARLSNKELAARVGLAPSSCLERVRRLSEDGYFRGFHADLDPRLLGVGVEAMVSIGLTRHNRDQLQAFRHHALSLPEVVALYHLTGKADFLLHVVVRDLDHLRDLALTSLTAWPEVDHMETAVIFEHVRKHGLPILVEVEAPG